MSRRDGHSAVITGASSRTGRATARLFASRGARVVLAAAAVKRFGRRHTRVNAASVAAYGELVESASATSRPAAS